MSFTVGESTDFDANLLNLTLNDDAEVSDLVYSTILYS